MACEELKLDHQLCFPLYAASKEVLRRYEPLLKGLDLTYTQYIVLLCLWEKDDVFVKELGERLFLDSGTLSPLLEKLEKKGLIKKVTLKEDRRYAKIRLTQEGKDMEGKAREIPSLIAPCMNLDLEEAATLYRLLYKILRGEGN